MPFLRSTGPGGRVEVVELRGAVTVLGRSQDCDMPLEEAAASRRHCQVRKDMGGWVLEDLRSKNGTFLNGAPVERSPLKDGDVIFIGDHQVAFREKA